MESMTKIVSAWVQVSPLDDAIGQGTISPLDDAIGQGAISLLDDAIGQGTIFTAR